LSTVVDHATLKKMPPGIAREEVFFELGDSATGRSVSAARCLAAVTKFVEHVALDFGAIDIVEDDHGRVYIIDVNATPFWGQAEPKQVIRHLADGFRIGVHPSCGTCFAEPVLR
jgi:hypothetical protein